MGILTQNLATFKRWDGFKDETILILWRFTEKSNFQGGSRKSNIQGGIAKKGRLGQFADLRGGELGKKEGVDVLRGD